MQALPTIPPSASRAASTPWPLWWFHTLLTVLFLGPIASPLFQATHLPLLQETGGFARDMLATYICPTPQFSYTLFGFPMGVCSRCWGATIGLWIARLWVPASLSSGGWGAAWLHRFRQLPWGWRLALCAFPFLLWPLEIIGAAQGWWGAPLWLLLINGIQAGVAAGLFFCSMWPGLWPAKASSAHT